MPALTKPRSKPSTILLREMSERLSDFEGRVGEFVRMATENMTLMRAQLAASSAPGTGARGLDEPAERALARIQAMVNAALERIGRLEETAAESAERLQAMEEGLGAMRKRMNDLHGAVADDFAAFEGTLKQHSSDIASARTAIGQTDDLVERVVDALEELRSGRRGERTEERLTAVN
jgi:hypothetical protein